MNSTLASLADDVTLLHNASGTANMTSEETSVTPSVVPSKFGKYGPAEQYTQFWIAFYINKYYLNVISAIGIPGNLLSMITILRMKPYSQPSIYVAILAVSDNLCLVCKILFIELTRHDVVIGDFGCKFLYFIGNVTAIFANWLVVMMTVERFLAIWFPLKIGTLCTRRRAVLGLGVMLLMVMILCSTFFVIAEGRWYEGGDFGCTYKDEYMGFVNTVWYWLDGTFYALLPCILLTIFNALIIIGIRRAAHIHRQLTEVSIENEVIGVTLPEARIGISRAESPANVNVCSMGMSDSNSRNKQVKGQAMEQLRQQRQITLMLVVMAVVFIILFLPNCIFFIYQPHWKVERWEHEAWSNYKCFEQIVFLLADCSHAINFFVYFVSAKKFRDRYLNTICCCCRKWKRRIARTSHVGQSQLSDTGSIYITSTSHSGVIPLSLRSSMKY